MKIIGSPYVGVPSVGTVSVGTPSGTSASSAHTITPPVPGTAAMDFSKAANSMYVGAIGG